MEVLRRRQFARTLTYEETRHLIKGDHADCRLDTRALRELWQAHREAVLAEFDRGTVEGRGEYVAWASVVFDGVRGEVRPRAYPYHHLEAKLAAEARGQRVN